MDSKIVRNNFIAENTKSYKNNPKICNFFLAIIKLYAIKHLR